MTSPFWTVQSGGGAHGKEVPHRRQRGGEELTELLQQRLPEATQFLTLVSPAIRVWEQWLVLKLEWGAQPVLPTGLPGPPRVCTLRVMDQVFMTCIGRELSLIVQPLESPRKTTSYFDILYTQPMAAARLGRLANTVLG